MYIYNVTINIEEPYVDEWLAWMKSTHVPDVLKTGLFTEGRIIRVLADEDGGGKTYSIQYYFKTMEDFNLYEQKFAPALRAEHTAKYKDKFVAFRTLLEIID
ncbi:MAG TPA: DUF4286 family protein [Bacteroidia bacterium]|nr:DUF4286 family protein [Bacteroidia bacterium]HNU32649.1 DUF4286 family protein [Bacteroidia bacterium]